MKLLLLPLSPECWTSPDMILAVEQLQDAARRIRKGIDIRRERRRFTLACERIEAVALQQTSAPRFAVKGERAQSLINLLPSDGKACLPVVGPTDIDKVRAHLPKQISDKLPSEGGLVVILESYSDSQSLLPTPLPKVQTVPTDKPLVDVDSLDVPNPAAADNAVLRRTHEQIHGAIKTGRPFGWISVEAAGNAERGLARHEVLITALREYVWLDKPPSRSEIVQVRKRVPDERAMALQERQWWYQLLKAVFPALLPKHPPMKTITVSEARSIPLPIEPRYVRVAFRDGSFSAPFPLLCLLPTTTPAELSVMHAALISTRHFEMDLEVDLCILRNSDISRRQDASIAEQEQIAFDRTTAFLQGCLTRFPGLELRVYHTGLEPIVIGFYRAVIEILRLSSVRGRLLVVPMLFRGHRYEPLKPWY